MTGYEGPRQRILVVDDVEANRSMLSDTLTRLGFKVDHASNGLEALANAKASLPNLIMMDIRMPVMGGLEAMRRMQELPDLSVIPVITVSAGVTEEEKIDCIAAGARAFLSKPIEVEPMLHEIGRLLSLAWTQEAPPQAATTSSNGMRASDRFEIPAPQQMQILHELAKTGNMRAIREKADELATLNEGYRPFADRLTKLAIGYESKALLRLVEKYASEQQVELSETERST